MTIELSQHPHEPAKILDRIASSAEFSRDFAYIALLEEIICTNPYDFERISLHKEILGVQKFLEIFDQCWETGFFWTNILQVISKTTDLERWEKSNDIVLTWGILHLFLYALENVALEDVMQSPHSPIYWNVYEEHLLKKYELLEKVWWNHDSKKKKDSISSAVIKAMKIGV